MLSVGEIKELVEHGTSGGGNINPSQNNVPESLREGRLLVMIDSSSRPPASPTCLPELRKDNGRASKREIGGVGKKCNSVSCRGASEKKLKVVGQGWNR